MSKLIDIAYVRNYDIARKISKFFYEEGYDVGISNVTINTGTHGEHQNWRLDILERPIVAECKVCEQEEKIFENGKCIQCFTDEMLER
ncbi:hypothetical protein ACTHOQ_14100 [Solibacillus silvestris]|uniref:hypothetical protein n=1 Tax=Solibacillus silvestris TaxID=76853 RepID=UPI003F7EFA81